MASTPDDGFLSSDQNINRFLCKQKLNLRYFIQPLKTLPVELTGTKKKKKNLQGYGVKFKFYTLKPQHDTSYIYIYNR